jgi:hypothetical protein
MRWLETDLESVLCRIQSKRGYEFAMPVIPINTTQEAFYKEIVHFHQACTQACGPVR